jgi:hypothetical protein
MHMGLSNDPVEHGRAESLSHYLLRKIPNSLVRAAGGREVFGENQESVKLQQTRRIVSLGCEPSTDGVLSGGGVDPILDVSRSAGSAGRTSNVTNAEQGASDELSSLDQRQTIRHRKLATPKETKKADEVRVALQQSARQTVCALPPLDELFCSPDKYHFHGVGLSLEASVAAYHRVTQAGCRSTEQLLGFMKEAKQYLPCTCSRHSSADAGSVLHADHCASRSAGAWAEALTRVGVPYAYALLVVGALRAHLN